MTSGHYYITYLSGKNFSNLQADNFYKFIVRNSVSEFPIFPKQHEFFRNKKYGSLFDMLYRYTHICYAYDTM